MKPEYEQWIEARVREVSARRRPGEPVDPRVMLGRCQEEASLMAGRFPELAIVKGHVATSWGRRAHWWLVTAEGEVVDPTAGQFLAIFEYLPWKPGDEVQVGRCVNCGDGIWRAVPTLDPPPPQESICSEACAAIYEAYLSAPHECE